MKNTNVIEESVDIPAYKIDYLKKAIAKLNRKANKLGCQPMVLTFNNEHTIKYNFHPITNHRLLNPIIMDMVTAILTYNIPNIDGYELIARLDIFPDQDKNMVFVSPVPGKQVPLKYLNAETIQCDHCGHNRYRTHSILLRHIESGEHKEVGSTCVKDFFHGNNPAGFMHMASIKFESLIGEIKDEDALSGYGYHRVPWSYSIDAVLTLSAAAIRKWGYLSKSKAEIYGGQTTTSHVFQNLDPNAHMKNDEFVNIEEKDKELAQKTLEYFKNLDPGTNDYLSNCHKIADIGSVPSRYMGYACSMITSYQRAMEQLKKSENSTSQHVGTIGQRIRNVKVTVIGKREFDSDFGIKILYTFKDESGNIYKTFYSGNTWSCDINNVVELTGTIKKHGEYNGIKETLLNRVQIS